MYQINKTDIYQVIFGGALLGSGGGGGIEMAQQLWDQLPDDLSIDVLASADVGDRNGCVVAFMGAPLAATVPDITPLVDAFESMDAIQAGSLSIAMAVEVGPVNSLAPMIVANAKNVAILDADGAGRAVPQLTMLTYANTVPISPVILTNGHGVNTTTWVTNPTEVEQLARPILTAPEFGGFGGLACWTATGAQIRANALWGTLSQTRDLGAKILAGSTAQEIATYLSSLRDGGTASVIATGTMKAGPTVTSGGFDLATVLVTQADGSVVTIFVQNENLLAYNNTTTQVLAHAPDLICYWNNATNMPFTNVEIGKRQVPDGTSVSIIRVPRLAEVQGFPAVMAGYQQGLENLGYAGIVDEEVGATHRWPHEQPRHVSKLASYSRDRRATAPAI